MRNSDASALACLEEDEKQLGVTLVDMGGGVTSFSVFGGGKNVYVYFNNDGHGHAVRNATTLRAMLR